MNVIYLKQSSGYAPDGKATVDKKVNHKNFKKSLDKKKFMWYNENSPKTNNNAKRKDR